MTSISRVWDRQGRTRDREDVTVREPRPQRTRDYPPATRGDRERQR